MPFTAEKSNAYSASERRVLELLNKHAPIESTKLTGLFYKGRKRPPNAQVAVMGVVRSLASKLDENGEAFTLLRSERMGQHPMQIKLAKR